MQKAEIQQAGKTKAGTGNRSGFFLIRAYLHA
jgi:hypothetical protein